MPWDTSTEKSSKVVEPVVTPIKLNVVRRCYYQLCMIVCTVRVELTTLIMNVSTQTNQRQLQKEKLIRRTEAARIFTLLR